MAIDTIFDFLAKQVIVERNVVTYRSLSRSLGIHVNAAKNSLASFYEANKSEAQPICATYLVSGVVKPVQTPIPKVAPEGQKMAAEDTVDYEVTSAFRMILVEERVLESTLESGFEEVTSHHIYSLSPARVMDPAILIPPTDIVREKDAQGRKSENTAFGRVVNPGIEAIKSKPAQQKDDKPDIGQLRLTSSHTEEKKALETVLKKSTSLQSTLRTKPVAAKLKAQPSTVDSSSNKSKPSKASQPIADAVPDKPPSGPAVAANEQSNVESTQSESQSGNKKVSASTSDKPDPQPPAKSSKKAKASADGTASQSVRLQKRTVLSDGEDEPVRTGNKKRKSGIQGETEQEKSLRSMMDVDDDEISRASRAVEPAASASNPKIQPAPEEEEEEEEEEGEEEEQEQEADILADSTPVQYIDQKQKKSRKQKTKDRDIPMGSNGLKKRKVTKTRKEKDKKGRTVTVDYSDWETASEDEAKPSTQSTTDNVAPQTEKKVEPKKKITPPKKTKLDAANKKDLMGFFSKKSGAS